MDLQWTFLDTWIVVIGVMSSVACALLGNYLVLRRLSMMGDAISHAVLPGLAVAFLVSGSRGSLTMFIGAAIVGVLTALFTQWIHRFGQVEQSASMGVVFTALFALGLIIIVRAADSVDLDPGCVLYGAIELVPLDTVSLWGWSVPRAVITVGSVLILDLVFIILFYKELKISSFDESLATTLGINSALMHYLLMTLVAVTTVAAFESVGSILVIAMLIVPGATAHLLTDRLRVMIVLSVVIAAVCAGLGHLAAIIVPIQLGVSGTSTAGMMAVVAGLVFFIALLFAPRHGVLSKQWVRFQLGLRIVAEDILGLLYRIEELPSGVTHPGIASIVRDATTSDPLTRWWAFRRLASGGLVEQVAGEYTLTDDGRDDARRLVRTHRLWESYLVKNLALSPDHVHPTAEMLEHITSPGMEEQLAEKTDRPDIDPHGRKIPEP
jgi:manganese/zinc/iron transport system permease protein